MGGDPVPFWSGFEWEFLLGKILICINKAFLVASSFMEHELPELDWASRKTQNTWPYAEQWAWLGVRGRYLLAQSLKRIALSMAI